MLPSAAKLHRIAKQCGTALALMALMAVYSGQEGPLAQVTRLMSAAAQVGESAGRAASLVLDRGADFTAGATTAVLTISSTTSSAAEAAWHGIDLADMSCAKTAGRVLADDGLLLADWFNSSAGRVTTKAAQQEALDLWIAQVSSVGLSMPVLESFTEFLQPDGSYWKAEGRTRLLTSGLVACEFLFVKVSFRPVWANPLWDALNLNLSTEVTQISSSVRTFAETVNAVNVTWGRLDDGDTMPANFTKMMFAKVKRWLRAFSGALRLLILEVCSLRGFGIALAITLVIAPRFASQANLWAFSVVGAITLPTYLITVW